MLYHLFYCRVALPSGGGAGAYWFFLWLAGVGHGFVVLCEHSGAHE
jgi:hypothetical protein